MTLNNPAGRLHALLSDFDARAAGGLSVYDVWQKVLGLEGTANVLGGLARVASLLPQIEEAIDNVGDEGQRRVYEHFWPMWASAIFAPTHNMTQSNPTPTVQMVDDGSLVALGGLAGFLDVTAAEGVTPTPDDLAKLRLGTAELMDLVRQSVEIPADVQRMLLDHLHALDWALDDLRFGGPGGVKAAAERLVGTVAIFIPDEKRDVPEISKLMKFLASVYVAFSAGPAVNASLEGWSGVIHQITS